MSTVTPELLEALLLSPVSCIEQKPPIYSKCSESNLQKTIGEGDTERAYD